MKLCEVQSIHDSITDVKVYACCICNVDAESCLRPELFVWLCRSEVIEV